MLIHEITSRFRENMFSNGIASPQTIHASGKIERFYIDGDKSGTKNGWYILFSDEVPSGVYGSWKTGITHIWSMKSKEKMSHFERNRYLGQIREAVQQRDQLRILAQKNAAQLAEARFYSYETAEKFHPYLIKKRILPLCARSI